MVLLYAEVIIDNIMRLRCLWIPWDIVEYLWVKDNGFTPITFGPLGGRHGPFQCGHAESPWHYRGHADPSTLSGSAASLNSVSGHFRQLARLISLPCRLHRAWMTLEGWLKSQDWRCNEFRNGNSLPDGGFEVRTACHRDPNPIKKHVRRW